MKEQTAIEKTVLQAADIQDNNIGEAGSPGLLAPWGRGGVRKTEIGGTHQHVAMTWVSGPSRRERLTPGSQPGWGLEGMNGEKGAPGRGTSPHRGSEARKVLHLGTTFRSSCLKGPVKAKLWGNSLREGTTARIQTFLYNPSPPHKEKKLRNPVAFARANGETWLVLHLT